MTTILKKTISIVTLAAGGLLLLYTLWFFGNRIYYALGIESQVKATVREMVRPEALR
jgi:hypothetical protein